MSFFARPILDNTQFVQYNDSVLTLSGQTQIATISGLTLTDGVGGYVPIIATGGSNNYVLTYDNTGGSPVIRLKESTASGGTGVYDCASPTTCTVGGLPAGTAIFNCPINDILQCIDNPKSNDDCEILEKLLKTRDQVAYCSNKNKNPHWPPPPWEFVTERCREAWRQARDICTSPIPSIPERYDRDE